MNRSVRLPLSSARRGEHTHLKLIERVLPLEAMGWAFEGKVLRPGRVLDERELWPTEHSPRIPLLLELGGIATPGRGHKRSSHLYILWKYDKILGEFHELARVAARGTEWVEPLKSVALRELQRNCEECIERAEDASRRVIRAIERELSLLGVEARRQFTEMIYEEVCSRLADVGFS